MSSPRQMPGKEHFHDAFGKLEWTPFLRHFRVAHFAAKGVADGKEARRKVSAGIPSDGGRSTTQMRQRCCPLGRAGRLSTFAVQVATATGADGAGRHRCPRYSGVHAYQGDLSAETSVGREGA